MRLTARRALPRSSALMAFSSYTALALGGDEALCDKAHKCQTSITFCSITQTRCWLLMTCTIC